MKVNSIILCKYEQNYQLYVKSNCYTNLYNPQILNPFLNKDYEEVQGQREYSIYFLNKDYGEVQG